MRRWVAGLRNVAALHTVQRPRVLGLIAAFAAILGTSVYAQSQSDFIDPLGEERNRIERQEPPALPSRNGPKEASEPEASPDSLLSRARESAKTGTAAAQDQATGLWARMRAAVSEVAASFGLPTSGLLGLLGLLLAGLICLIAWTFFRGRKSPKVRPAREHHSDDLYDRSKNNRVRRRLGDANPLKSGKADEEQEVFHEAMPENFDEIFRDEGEAKERAASIAKPVSGNPATWKKPNLDRLRDSIKMDWKAEKALPAGAVAAGAVAASVPRADFDPADQSLDDISDGWDAWDAQPNPDDEIWGDAPLPGADVEKDDDDAAVQRIRALRESLRVS